MKIVVTGAFGFLGWHLRARLHALSEATVVPVGRAELLDRVGFARSLQDADVIIHVAGANRGDPAEVAATNIELDVIRIVGMRARCRLRDGLATQRRAQAFRDGE